MSGDTIHALATAPGRAGVAIIRVSGPAALSVLEALTTLPAPTDRPVFLRKLRSEDGDLLDQALILTFEENKSFTGEPVVEFQIHGSRAVISAVLREIERTGLSRPAGAGEFTRRALQNDRLDVLQVQGLGNLLDAETERQRKAAVEVADGTLGDLVREWRTYLVEAASLIEATLDFVEEDVPVDVTPLVQDRLARVRVGIQKQLSGVQAARRIQDGFVVAILGAPNAGKSSLINALSRSDVVIVSDIPGTTRDTVEVRMDIDGLLVRLLDTAGLRETTNPIEREGVERARRRAVEADFRILLVDGSQDSGYFSDGEIATDLVVKSKADLTGGFGISVKTGDGLDDLISMIGRALSDRVEGTGLVSSTHDEALLRRALTQIDSALVRLESSEAELLSEDLRLVMQELSAMIGEVDIEDILDHIFRSFCIGK